MLARAKEGMLVMARSKKRETYRNGSVSAVMVDKVDASGTAIVKADGEREKVQEKDAQGRPLWRVCISLGTEQYTDKDGRIRKRQRKVQKVVHGSIDDARKVAKKLTAQYESIKPDAYSLTFAYACDAWEKATRNAGTATPNVIANYVRDLGHMRKHLGEMPLLSITQQDIESALAAVKVERHISNTTLHRVYAVTKRVFAYAEGSEWIVKNPMKKIAAPRIDEVVNRRSLTKEECALLRARLDSAEDKAYRAFEEKELRQSEWGNTFGRSCIRGLSELSCIIALRIELATGMRRSEVLGLVWSAVDFERAQIVVRQKLIASERKGTPKDGALIISNPKTKKGTRSLHVDAGTLTHLKRWKAFQEKALHLVMPDGIAGSQSNGTPVCTGDNGSWLRPASISRWWGTPGNKGFRDTIGFPDLRMHELRHTQATQLLGAGVDVKTVQTRMGHAKSSHTLDLYAHAIPANDAAAANIMDAILSAPTQPAAAVLNLEKTA